MPQGIYCRAFYSRAVTVVFHDLGLSCLGFEQTTFRMRGEHTFWINVPPVSSTKIL